MKRCPFAHLAVCRPEETIACCLVFFRNPNISYVMKPIFLCHMLLHTNQIITVTICYAICKRDSITVP